MVMTRSDEAAGVVMVWQRLATNVVHRSPWFEVRSDDVVRPDGGHDTYTHVVAPGSVTVLAIQDDDHVVLTRQWIYTHGGTEATNLDAIEWAAECQERGAGEILLTSIDQDGARSGYDLELTRTVADQVPVPVIASGGAGGAEHLRDAFAEGHASAALVAGILHDGLTTVGELKSALAGWGVAVRPADTSNARVSA